MGLLILAPKDSKTNVKFQLGSTNSLDRIDQGQVKCQVQTLQCSINKHSFSFVYCRTTPSTAETEWIKKMTNNIQYLMGDLNLEPTKHDQNNKLQTICNRSKKSLLKEITTKNGVQLDHILGIEKKEVRIFTTSFVNFVSDHKSVMIRISESGSKFIEDQRLEKCYEDDIIVPMDVELEESVDDPDTLKMPPPATPPVKKRKLFMKEKRTTNQ